MVVKGKSVWVSDKRYEIEYWTEKGKIKVKKR